MWIPRQLTLWCLSPDHPGWPCACCFPHWVPRSVPGIQEVLTRGLMELGPPPLVRRSGEPVRFLLQMEAVRAASRACSASGRNSRCGSRGAGTHAGTDGVAVGLGKSTGSRAAPGSTEASVTVAVPDARGHVQGGALLGRGGRSLTLWVCTEPARCQQANPLGTKGPACSPAVSPWAWTEWGPAVPAWGLSGCLHGAEPRPEEMNRGPERTQWK